MKLKLNDDNNLLNSSSLSPFPHPRVRSHNPSPTFLSFLSIRDPLLIKPNEKAQTPHLFIPSTPSLSKSNSDVSLNKLQNESLVSRFLLHLTCSYLLLTTVGTEIPFTLIKTFNV